MKPFRWAFVGASVIATKVADVITQSSRHQIIGIWNRTKEKAQTFANHYQSKVYDDLDALCQDENVDGIYMSVTTQAHKDIALKILSYKKPLLIEKTFAVNHLEAIEIFDYAKKQQTYVAEAMWTWFNDAAITTKDWLNKGYIGDIEHVKISYAFPMIQYMKSDRLVDVNKCGGAMMDIGVYPIHYAVDLFGIPKAILTHGKVVNKVDHSVDIKLTYDHFDVDIIVAMDEFKGERFTAFGSDGYIRVPWFHMNNRVKLCTKSRDRKKFIGIHGIRNQLFLVEFDRVSEEIRQQRITSQYVSPESVIETMKIMDEIRKQIGVVFPGEQKER